MKLYFYFLETKIGTDLYLGVEEYKVEEKKKTYKFVGNTPTRYVGESVKKEDIGKVMNGSCMVILTENNPKKAAECFRDDFKCRIIREETIIVDAKRKVEELNTYLDVIERMWGNASKN